MPAVLMVHDEDPADLILDKAGDLSEVEVFNSQVLVGVYQRPEEAKTEGGIILTHKTTDEDRFQSKVGLILKMGPKAFQDSNDPPSWFINQYMVEGDWVVFRPSSGWNVTLISKDHRTGKKKELLCRMVDDVSILGRIDNPDRVY